MRIYEELFIVKPDRPKKRSTACRTVDANRSPTAAAPSTRLNKWGIRKLAYRVQKYNEGFYVLLQFTAAPGDGEGDRTPHARHGLGDQVHHGPHRREAEETSRSARRTATSAPPANRRRWSAPALPEFAAPAPGAPAPGAPALPCRLNRSRPRFRPKWRKKPLRWNPPPSAKRPR